MKKALISILIACLAATSAWGTKVITFETNPNAFYPAVIPLVFRSDGVTLSVFGTARDGGFSFYSDEWSFISTSQGVITDIVLERPSTNFVFSTGSYHGSGLNGYWSGEAQQVNFCPYAERGTTGKIIVMVDDGNDDEPEDYTTLIAIYQNDRYTYCKDLINDEYVLFYGDMGNTFVNGDTIAGYYEVMAYDNYPLFTPVGDWWLVAHGPAVKPMEMPIEDLSQNMINQYLCFKNVNMSESWVIYDETGNLQLFNKFGIEVEPTLEPDADVQIVEEVNIATLNALIDRILSGNVCEKPSYATYYVEGFLTVYRGQLELYPTHIQGQGFNRSDDFNGDGEVNLSDVNIIIDYILGN